MDFIIKGMAPKPTAPPTQFQLERRAEASDQIVLSIAPDNICGFVSERVGASRACPVDDRCYFFPPITSQSQSNGGVICCGETTCQYHATCINSREYFQSSKCDGGCEVDNFTLKCTKSNAPYCNTVSWKGNTIDYWCNDIDITTAQSAALTFKGQTNVPKFVTVNQEDLSSIQSQISGAKTAGGPTQTSEPTATETNADDGGSSETPVAAIVGGTVSGVAVLAALLGFFLFLRRKKRHSKDKNPPENQQGPGGNENKSPWLPGQQPGAPYYYDPNSPQSNISPNSQYVYPQAAGFQPQQNVIHEAGGEAVDPDSKPQELAGSKKEPAELA
ncbi:hypothetical protein FLONG3_5583 [Fusarium longipes]|uniref:Uncharacterized protein n=1 Tax=Fusarium longipes TaxID=694270 RepID=A0A395SUB7_9HYPO|nr:hypothetical protein FLONG3_5583 [Fusarium longipes]